MKTVGACHLGVGCPGLKLFCTQLFQTLLMRGGFMMFLFLLFFGGSFGGSSFPHFPLVKSKKKVSYGFLAFS